MSGKMPLIRTARREKSLANRDTRWDRIRKRHTNSTSLSLKTDTVKRFIEMDFIGRNNETMLKGEQKILNPTVVMDVRHAMFQKAPRQLPLATVANQKPIIACVAHNIAVEEHYITNQLNHFRKQLEKNHKRNTKVSERAQHSLKLDNVALVKSLEATSKHIEDFYAAPIEALQKVQEMYKFTDLGDSNSADGEGEDKENEESVFWANETDADEICEKHEPEEPLHMRCVHFEDEVEVRQICVRDHSGRSYTSDGIDSVISHLAEEALRELEEEDKQQQQLVEEEEEKRQLQQELPVQTGVDNATDTLTSSSEDGTERPPAPIMRIQIEGHATGEEAVATGELLIVRRLDLQQPSSHGKSKHALADGFITSSEEEGDDPLSTASNHEQNHIIETLFQARAHTNVATMRKYLLQWIHYTTIAKIERENCTSRNDRVHKINVFLDKMRREKRRPACEQRNGENGTAAEEAASHHKDKIGAVQITKKYQNKIKVQQDIIDLQRVKLERQERLIMQLKLNKLSEEALDARQQIKDELKTVIRCGDAKSRAKAKCLQLIGNLRDPDDEDDFERLRGRALQLPKFLQNMQERALERSVRHEQARHRRLQQEAEREAQKMAAEEAKRLEDEEAKQMRIAALKEKRRLEKMEKVTRERDRQRVLANTRKAQEFYRRHLLRAVGMEAFKRMLERKRHYQQQCVALRRRICQRACFQTWRAYSNASVIQKTLRAEEYFNALLKRLALTFWKNYVHEERSKMYTACDWYDMKLSDQFFMRWRRLWQRDKAITEKQMVQAKSHHEWNTKWRVIECWRNLPHVLLMEKKAEGRRQRWRMKIWEMVPDYNPKRDEFPLP